MKNINLIALCLFAAVAFALCSCGSSLTPVQDAMKRSYPFADVPKNVRNAKPDANLADEKAVVVTVRAYGKTFFLGNEEYDRADLQRQLEKLFEKNPAAKQLVYLNADASAEYGIVVQALDIIRRTDAESVGLMVAGGADQKTQILKIKNSAEPQSDDPEDLLDRRLVINLQKDGKIKLGRFDKWSFKATAPDIVDAAEIGGRLAPLFRENEDKKINLRGTSEIDKTIFVKAARSNRYGEVVRLADAALGAGASEVYLMLDDLEG